MFRKLIYLGIIVLFIFLYTKSYNTAEETNSDSLNNSKRNKEILSKETLKEIDSLNKHIDSITIKNDIKVGSTVETRISIKKDKEKR